MNTKKIYKLLIDDDEMDTFIQELVKYRELPNEQQLRKNKYLLISARHAGAIMADITEARKKVPKIWKQLVTWWKMSEDEAGVVTTNLENNMIRLEDRNGNVIVRQRYEWEDEWKNES